MRKRLSLFAPALVLAAIVLPAPARAQGRGTGVAAPAQPAGAETSAPGATAPRADLYRIGPRDVLSVRVSAGHHVPELSTESVEVDECGRIPLASVQHEEQNEVQAAGLTRFELQEKLRAFYLKYKRNPQVIVSVREYNSQPVAVTGAVVKPGQFQMRRPVQLLELVKFYAGGPTERAGGTVQVARTPAYNACSDSAPAPVEFFSFKLDETLSGVPAANPLLQPGDVVTLTEAKEVYVVGNVLRPGAVIFKDDSLTVSRAIAMAGGTMPDTSKKKIRIIRPEANGTKKEILVDLGAINNRKAKDVALLPNDIVDVPVAGGKRILRSLVSTIVPSVGQLPVQIIR